MFRCFVVHLILGDSEYKKVICDAERERGRERKTERERKCTAASKDAAAKFGVCCCDAAVQQSV